MNAQTLKKITRKSLLAVTLSMTMFLVACGGGGDGGGGSTTVTLESIAVTPGTASIPDGGSTQFVATGTYSDGSTINLSASAAWEAVGGTGNATISASGLAKGTGVGDVTISATETAISGSATLTVTDFTVEALMGDRMVATRLDNGAYGISGNITATIDKGAAGNQGSTGTTALGLLEAHGVSPRAAWATSLGVTKDYLLGVMADYVASDGGGTVAMGNYVFMKRYDDIIGLTTAEWDDVNASLTDMLANKNTAHGTVAGVTIDGILNLYAAGHTTDPGLLSWDFGFFLKVAVAYGLAAAEIDYTVARIKLLMDANIDGTVDFDPTSVRYGYLGTSHSLESLSIAGDIELEAGLLTSLKTGLSGDYIVDGYGTFDDDLQTTNYALMAFKQVGDAQATATTAWLLAQPDVDGIISFSNIEWYEVSGEALDAIVQ